MDAAYHRHDISDRVWEMLKPLLPGQRGQWGGIAQDTVRVRKAPFITLHCGELPRILKAMPHRKNMCKRSENGVE